MGDFEPLDGIEVIDVHCHVWPDALAPRVHELFVGIAATLGHSVCTGTLILNTSTGALMRATSTGNPARAGASTVTVNAVGLGNVFSGGTTLSASSPLYIANDTISIDLSGTRRWRGRRSLVRSLASRRLWTQTSRPRSTLTTL